MPTMDWKKETGGEFVVYPAATYHVRIVNWERVKASTGTEQVRWRAEIITPEEFRGKTILEHTPLTDASLWRIANFVAALGVNTKNCPKVDTNSSSFDAILDACKERKVFWLVQEEIGTNGKPRNKIVDYKQDDSQEVVEPTSSLDIPWEQ